MTWTSAAIPAPETTARSANRPFLVGTHIGDGCRPIWTSDTGEHTDTDESAATGPAIYAVDRRGAHETFPGGITADEWWLSFGLVTTAEGIDSILLLSDLGTTDVVGGIQVAIEVADDAAYSTNLAVIHDFTPTQDRWVDRFALRWTGSGYIRLHLTAGQVFRPRIREAWIGRTRQLRGGVRTGRDLYAIGSGMETAGVDLASTTAREQALGRTVLGQSVRLHDTLPALEDTATVRAWWAATDHGRHPFVWHVRPAASQHDARIMGADGGVLDLPAEDGFARVLEQGWVELPPYRATE